MTTGKTGVYMKIKKLILNLFDGGAAGGVSAGATAPTSGGESSAPSEAPVGYKSRKQAAAERERMAQQAIRGNAPTIEPTKTTTEEAPTEEVKEETKQPEAEAPKDYKAQLDEMMKDPEFRKEFSNRMQSKVDERFKKSKATEAKLEALAPVLSFFQTKYGTKDGDIEGLVKAFSTDNEIFEALGEKNGLSGEQQRNVINLEYSEKRERQMRMELEAQIKAREAAQRISDDAERVRQSYPEFDLAEALKHPQISKMIKSGVDLKTAYEVVNLDNIKNQTVADTEKKVVESIQTRSTRPVEGGATSQTGVITQNAATRLTRAERERLAQRAIRGEVIPLK